MRQIVDSVQRITQLVEAIVSANSQQAAGISQLNDSIAQLDQIRSLSRMQRHRRNRCRKQDDV